MNMEQAETLKFKGEGKLKTFINKELSEPAKKEFNKLKHKGYNFLDDIMMELMINHYIK